MLDYPKIKEIFMESIEKSASEISKYLMQYGKKWRDGRPPDDDITFVVIKAKNE